MKTRILLLAGLALTACTPPAPLGPQPTFQLGPRLSAPEIAAEMVGNTGTGPRTATTALYSMYVAPDGTLASRIYQRTDKGTWRITGDGFFCTTWQVDFDGKEVCHDVHKAGTVVELHSPTALEELTFVPGNHL
ncbi:MAG TPA: hypothetical protein VHT04_13725 [Stellaceae bacterium]|nr:hypothetical protein [Stellaceae bacterium]